VALIAIGACFSLMAMGLCVALAAALRSWLWLAAAHKTPRR